MAMKAKQIIDRAQTILQDTTSVRWLLAELVNWFNDGQREIVLYRPETSSVTTQFTLVSGNTKQTIDAAASPPPVFSPSVTNPMRLIEVIRNFKLNGDVGRAVRLVAREIMDSQNPNWHADTAADEIKHYLFDARDPKTFYVWPKPSGASKLEVIISAAPAEINAAGVSADTAVLALDDIYANAVLDYILYRAYMKDSEYAGNAQRAAAHYAAFANSLGVRIASEKAVSPVMNTVFNPNNPIAVTGGGAAAA